ncbi:MAG TPA: ATP-dependent DNA ligase [Dictyoglomaceae bacterium]|nr:ATP-dependent DNA ligase [Dictyoglomaceae bacterium]HOL38977.1 ATP-dependent DNA ligase [Dictyoglomaceae bacterium]HPP15847.1 ATP-dependent DNA ligase [Dictyoglomaceae bacterium]
MLFSELSEYFQKIEATTKRNEMIEILSELFKEADKEEIDKIIYLLNGRVAPEYEKIEFGISEKLALKAVATSLNKPVIEVENIHKEIGDLGEIVLRNSKGEGKDLSVIEVFNVLYEIATFSGEGSVDAKVNRLAYLVNSLTPQGGKYVVRVVLGKLRLGIGEPTIMDALSFAKAKDKSLRVFIERAFNITSDLGYVAKVFWEGGIEALKKIKVQVGRPIRMALAERVPSVEDIIKKLGKCSIEPKFDGFRCQIHRMDDKVRIFSRNLEDNTHMFPDLVEGILEQVKSKGVILEGEAISYDPETGEFYPFQVTVQRKRKYNISEMAELFPLQLFAFDILYIDGEDITSLPYIRRRERLENAVEKGEKIFVTENIITNDPKEIQNYFEECITEGLEGVVAKRLDAPYQAGVRNFNWIKLKRSYQSQLSDTVDCVILGYFKGRGHRAKFGIGALLVGVYDKGSDTFKTIAKIGTGATEEEWVKFREILDEIKVENKPYNVDSLIEADVWVDPKYVVEIQADEITRSPIHTCGKEKDGLGYALRFPRVIGFIRDDKFAFDATTVDEILEMFRFQRKEKADESSEA